MVLYRRRRQYRKKSTLKRLTRPRKGSAIQTLAKQVMSIKKSMRKEREIVNYQFNTNQYAGGTIGDGTAAPFYQFPLSQFPNWARVFGTTANDDDGNSMIWKSFGLDIHVRSYNETDQVNFTMFLVSLKPEAAAIYSTTTGLLSLTAGQEYVNSSTGATDTASGLVMLNKKVFNIHSIKRFTLGNNGAALNTSSAQTQYGTDRRFYLKVAPNRKVINPYGDWKVNNAIDTRDAYFVLIFNNNSSADAENPRVFINSVHTVQQLS